MATVTGLTAERMIEIEEKSIVDGDVVGGNLILTRYDGTQINAGSVIGPEGPEGPVGSDLSVLSAKPILDIGLVDQIRAGRQLGPADFANIQLSPPLGLWNLSGLTDSSGNGRNLLNKGSTPFSMGINGIATTCVLFVGSVAQVLYIADTGAADPFRIKMGSVGCWFRTAKRGVSQSLVTKRGAAPPTYGYQLAIGTNNFVGSGISSTGTDFLAVFGVSDVCDDRWHFAVFTYDGTVQKIYVDGVLEGVTLTSFPIFGSSAPLNIGGINGDGSVAPTDPSFGRIDEAFITSDVLTEDQVRNLYCAKIPHTLAAIPSKVILNILRRRKGPAFVTGDFPAQPDRLYNFSAGSLSDIGSDNQVLTNTGTAVSVSGVDGTPGNAFHLAGAQYLSSTDTGLPAGTTSHSFGCWVKTILNSGTAGYIITWGASAGVNDQRLYIANGAINFGSGSDAVAGPFIADGNWHFVVVVHNNTPGDGIKRKLYVDGRLVATSLVMNSTTLGGATKFLIGASQALNQFLTGQIDSVFVSSSAFTLEDILKLYTKGIQALAPSPKNVGDHIEAMSDTDLLAIFDTLDSVSQIDMKVSA